MLRKIALDSRKNKKYVIIVSVSDQEKAQEFLELHWLSLDSGLDAQVREAIPTVRDLEWDSQRKTGGTDNQDWGSRFPLLSQRTEEANYCHP